MAYASLGNSYQWNLMNGSGDVTNRIIDIMKNGNQVTPEQIASTLVAIRNRIKSPIFSQLMDYLNSGRIAMVYSEQIKIPIYLPFILIKNDAKTSTGIVFLNQCECVPGETEYTVDSRKLKTSLESCYLALRMMELDSFSNPKLTSPDLIRPSTKIYVHSIIECINRKYTIKYDQEAYNRVSFMLSRFFINTVLGYNPDYTTLENFCLYDLKNADLGSIRLVNDQFEVEDFANISKFIEKLVKIPELMARLGKLNVNSFVQMYISLYNAPMTLALEVYPYLVFNILSVLNTTYVNNYHMLKNIVGEDGSKLYAYLVTILAHQK